MSARTYLDWNATAPLRPEAREAMLSAMAHAGNPSSVHAEGRAARAIVEKARAEVAEAVGCKPDEVIFTSGATEAASVLARFPSDRTISVDPTAHDALWSHARTGDGQGHVLAMGLANSETGVITAPPAPEDVKRPGAAGMADLILLDVTQAIGRIPWSFAWSGVDMAVLSAHKLGGPKGVGALIVRDGLEIPRLSDGGGQELGRRSGTENTIGIAGFGAAAMAAMRDLSGGVWENVEKLRTILENTLEAAAKETIFVGNDLPRLPNTTCVAVPGWKGETQVMQLDLAGFAVSAGSACSSGKVRTSRVLSAMGFDDLTAASAIRVSLGPTTTGEDIARFCETWSAHYKRFRARAA